MTPPITRAARAATPVLLVAIIVTLAPGVARAGTYPMYQCRTAAATVAAGWSVYSFNTLASTVMSNTCADGGAIGGYVFTDGQPGAVTENGSEGSEVGLAINVPATAPDVTIQSIGATAIVSSASGDDAFLGFASAGQSLPGAIELPSGAGSDYTAKEQWTLPQAARDFEMFVNCTTDRSSPTCNFADSTHVPALSDITLTLADSVPPVLGGVSGTLASAAAAGATVSGTQTLSFDATDADSGVRSAALTLTPEGPGAPEKTTIDYGPECSYDSWNACPVTQDASTFALDTSTLGRQTYAVQLTVTDAAANSTSRYLGTITSNKEPHVANGFPCSHSQLSLRVNGKSKPRPVRYGRKLLITGRLRCANTPIPDASVSVAGRGVAGWVATNADGAFAYEVPAGPSRTLSFRYYAYSGDSSPAVSASVHIGVHPSISLQITPRQTSNGSTINWRGRILGGPYPPGGLTLLVEVKVGQRWQTFDQLQTLNGRFAYRYTFLRTTTTTMYTFRIALPASGAAGYDYLPASSRPVSVRVWR